MSKNISNNTLHLYTLGSGAVGVKNLLFGSWLLVYFNQILGLEPLLASYALAIALVPALTFAMDCPTEIPVGVHICLSLPRGQLSNSDIFRTCFWIS